VTTHTRRRGAGPDPRPWPAASPPGTRTSRQCARTARST